MTIVFAWVPGARLPRGRTANGIASWAAQRRDKALRNSALLNNELTVLTTASDRSS